MPLVLQRHSVYRNRALNYWWATNGVQVIPNVRWGDERTFCFAYAGLPQRSMLAVGAVGSTTYRDDRRHFQRGFEKMLEVTDPVGILLIGDPGSATLPPLLVAGTDVHRFTAPDRRGRSWRCD